MSGFLAVLHSRAALAIAAFLALCAGCGDSNDGAAVSVGAARDGGDMDEVQTPANPSCDMVVVEGDTVVEHERDFTATYRIGEPYTKTVMLFGADSVTEANVLSNAYVLGLDKEDALELAEEFPDFYLCSSPGGQAAANLVRPYDFVPADCEIYRKLVAAFRQFHANRDEGLDRTSIRFDGAPLELVSVIDNASGVDVSDQVTDQQFHLVTSVEQLTGESVLSFGTSN
jgi:hypothetical protein